MRNTVPRSGIFLQFAEQDRRFLPLKRKNLCFAEHSSAIRDFSSFCGTLFRDLGFFFVLRNRTGDFFRSNGIISVLRNTVPRSGIFLQFAEHCSAIWDFSSFCGTGQAISSAQTEKSLFCGTQFRDLGFFFVLRNRTGDFFRSNGKISVLRNIVPRSGIFLQFAEQDRRFLPLKRNNLCFAEHSSAIWDFSSVCGTLFRDLGFFLS